MESEKKKKVKTASEFLQQTELAKLKSHKHTKKSWGGVRQSLAG